MSIEAILVRIERKLDALAKPKAFWVNAKTIMKLTDLNSNGMNALRKNNPDWYKINKGGGYLYDVNKVPKILLKSTQTDE